MAFKRVVIPSLSGGVSTQSSDKRLPSEANDIVNCNLSLEKSVERRSPFLSVLGGNSVDSKKPVENTGLYHIPIPRVTVPTLWAKNQSVLSSYTSGYRKNWDGKPTNLNSDNIYIMYIDTGITERYAIVINRGAISVNPLESADDTQPTKRSLPDPNLGTYAANTITNVVSVFKVTPTEWIEEEVDISTSDRGSLEYLLYGNLIPTEWANQKPESPIELLPPTGAPTSGKFAVYYMAGIRQYEVEEFSTESTYGYTPYGEGVILWNKLVQLDFMPNNTAHVNHPNQSTGAQCTATSDPDYRFIFSGNIIDYKIASCVGGCCDTDCNPGGSVNPWPYCSSWINVRDDVIVNEEQSEEGQNLKNFGLVPQLKEDVQENYNDSNGPYSFFAISDYYDAPRVCISSTLLGDYMYTHDLNTDCGFFTAPGGMTPRIKQEAGHIPGMGKVYYAREGYLSFTSAFYKCSAFKSNPYFAKIRTENNDSVFDHRRFPLLIQKNRDTGKWQIKYLDLKERTSGTSLSSKGPSAVRNKERVKAITYWKERLWLGTEKTLMCSAVGDPNLFWVADVTSIQDTDTMDIDISARTSGDIKSITPFQTFMLVETLGSLQFEITGAGGAIGPSTLQVNATAALSVSENMNSLVLSSSLLIFGRGSFFTYTPTLDGVSKVTEVSPQCFGYFPTNPEITTTMVAKDTVFMVSKEEPSTIYNFTYRVSGENVLQAAASKQTISDDHVIISLKAFNDDFYVVAKKKVKTANKNTGEFSAEYKDVVVVYYTKIASPNVDTPFIDKLTLIEPSNIEYDIQSNTTKITVPFYDETLNSVVSPSVWNSETITQGNVTIPVLGLSYVWAGTGTTNIFTNIYVAGNWAYQINNSDETDTVSLPLYVGTTYKSEVYLSKPVIRMDDNSSVVTGAFSIRSMRIRHRKTGKYRVEGLINGVRSFTALYEPFALDNTIDIVGNINVDNEGVHFFPVMGRAENTDIRIISDYTTPLSISQIEYIGIFNPGKLGSIYD